MRALGIDSNRLDVVLMQLVKLMGDAKEMCIRDRPVTPRVLRTIYQVSSVKTIFTKT